MSALFVPETIVKLWGKIESVTSNGVMSEFHKAVDLSKWQAYSHYQRSSAVPLETGCRRALLRSKIFYHKSRCSGLRHDLHSSPLVWYTDIRSIFGWSESEIIKLGSNPDIWSACIYGQFSLDKTWTLQAGSSVPMLRLRFSLDHIDGSGMSCPLPKRIPGSPTLQAIPE